MNNFILHSNQFGFDMWIANDGTATDKKSDAMQFDHRDNPKTKENYYTAIAGYKFSAVAN